MPRPQDLHRHRAQVHALPVGPSTVPVCGVTGPAPGGGRGPGAHTARVQVACLRKGALPAAAPVTGRSGLSSSPALLPCVPTADGPVVPLHLAANSAHWATHALHPGPKHRDTQTQAVTSSSQGTTPGTDPPRAEPWTNVGQASAEDSHRPCDSDTAGAVCRGSPTASGQAFQSRVLQPAGTAGTSPESEKQGRADPEPGAHREPLLSSR